ncbi:hypothetical protein BHE74_00012954 [Ensete ventricosum]|nr:hypothetical protein GW17_00033764 [Ensete ventricosum]RWW78789.1 hypothetical protein BHE74_00012954 [Ensete ventricosum]
MAIEGQRDAKNLALIPSVRTLADFKLGVISIGDWPPWNSIGIPSSKLLLKGYRKYSFIHEEIRMVIRLFIGFLNPNSNRTRTPNNS